MNKLTKEEKFFYWSKDANEFDLKYKYPLSSNSVVLDIGAYLGKWSFEIWKRYKCRIWAFEPIFDFYNQADHLLNNDGIVDVSNKKIKVLNYAIGNSNRHQDLVLKNDASTFFAEGGETESTEVKDIVDVLAEFDMMSVDLVKMNVEGSEYEILERIIEANILHKFRHLQIQFHRTVDNYDERRKKIHTELRKTHTCDYNYEFIWESWSIK